MFVYKSVNAMTKVVCQGPAVNSLVEDAAIQKCPRKHRAFAGAVKESRELLMTSGS